IDEPCRCGRTSQRLRFLGRIDESTKVRGMFVYPEQIAEAMEPFGVEWHAVVSRDERGLDRFVIEVHGDADARMADGVRSEVRLRADIEPVDRMGGEPGHLSDRR